MKDEDQILSNDEFFEAEDVVFEDEDNQAEGEVDVDVDEEEDDDIQSIDSDADEKQDLDEGRSLYLAMLDEDLKTFLSRLKSYAPMNDKKHVKIRLKTVDWENVAFGRYGAKECELIWGFLQTKTRKYRILDELINEIRYNTEIVEDKEKFWKKILESDPTFPKKPPGATSAYNAYCYEMYQREANKPNYFLFAQKCQETFNSLSSKEKKKYQTKSDLAMANFEKQVKEFYAKHPNVTPMAITVTKKGTSWQFPRVTQVQRRKDRANDPPPVSPSTAMVNYIQHKLNRIHPAPSKDELKSLRVKYRDSFKALNKRTKGKWIDKHIRNIDQYLKDLEAYKIKYSYYEPKKEFNLSVHLPRSEIALWEEYKGKPFIPVSAQKVFQHEFQKENEDKTDEEIKELVAEKWKELGWYQKEEYGLKYKKAVMDYKNQIGEYFSNLPDFLKDHVYKNMPKKFQNLITNVSKLPTDPNILNIKTEGGNVDRNENMEEEQEQEEEPPKKKKKKSKKREDDEEPSTSTSTTRPNGTSNISEIIEDDEEPSYSKKKKKKKKKHKQSEDEETEVNEETEEEQLPIYKKVMTDYDKLRILEEKKKGKKMETLGKEAREMAELQKGKKIEDIITSISKTRSKPQVKDFANASSKKSQRDVNEAIRGIFDGRPLLGRFYSTYYFYAKYVASDSLWIAAYNEVGVFKCAEMIIQTFKSLPDHEKQVFIDQSHHFYIIKEYGNGLENPLEKKSRKENFYFVGEPPEPPRNAQSLYRKEMIQLHNVKQPGSGKKPQITPWNDLDEDVQQMYIRKLYQMTNTYLKNYENFILKMTPNDMITYTLARGKYWENSYMKYTPTLDTARGFAFPLPSPISEEIHGLEPEILTVKPTTSEERKAERIRRNPFSSENDFISKITQAIDIDPLLIVDENLSINKERGIVAAERHSDEPSSDSEEEDTKSKVFHKADLYTYKQIKKEATYHYPVKNIELPVLSKGQQLHKLIRMRKLQLKVAEAEAANVESIQDQNQQGQEKGHDSTSNQSEENPAEPAADEETTKGSSSGWYTRSIRDRIKIKSRANRPVTIRDKTKTKTKDNLNDRVVQYNRKYNRKRIITPAFIDDSDSDSTIVPSSLSSPPKTRSKIETETQSTPSSHIE